MARARCGGLGGKWSVTVTYADAEPIEARLRTGRPLADADWIAEMEARIARKLGPMKRGPKPKQPVSAGV